MAIRPGQKRRRHVLHVSRRRKFVSHRSHLSFWKATSLPRWPDGPTNQCGGAINRPPLSLVVAERGSFDVQQAGDPHKPRLHMVNRTKRLSRSSRPRVVTVFEIGDSSQPLIDVGRGHCLQPRHPTLDVKRRGPRSAPRKRPRKANVSLSSAGAHLFSGRLRRNPHRIDLTRLRSPNEAGRDQCLRAAGITVHRLNP